MTSRKQYEAWAKADASTVGVELTFERSGDEWYVCNYTNTGWAAWQASRAALVVELPAIQECDDHWSGDIEVFDAAEAREALNAAGVTYK